jgi:hypothetical protein
MLGCQEAAQPSPTLGAVAEFERNMIRKRVLFGMAKANGTRSA